MRHCRRKGERIWICLLLTLKQKREAEEVNNYNPIKYSSLLFAGKRQEETRKKGSKAEPNKTNNSSGGHWRLCWQLFPCCLSLGHRNEMQMIIMGTLADRDRKASNCLWVQVKGKDWTQKFQRTLSIDPRNTIINNHKLDVPFALVWVLGCYKYVVSALGHWGL